MPLEPNGDVGTQLLYEDDDCRVWLLDLPSGAASDWHVHSCDYVYVVTKATQVQTEYSDGRVDDQDDVVGATGYHTVDGGHRLVNRGDQAYRNIIVELKGVNGGT